jgi:uracil-DNA glycosylase
MNTTTKTWQDFISQESKKDYFNKLNDTLNNEYRTKQIYPDFKDILRPLKEIKLHEIKVVIIGQDPYHTPGVADGLAFSSKASKIPPSLKNIFLEIKDDLGIENTNPDLSKWSKQGVFLINSILSVEQGKPKSHHKIGWEHFVRALIKYIDEHCFCVFVLWGNLAKSYQSVIKNNHIITGYHPSPLAGGRFLGERYFSKINTYLMANDIKPIDWRT